MLACASDGKEIPRPARPPRPLGAIISEATMSQQNGVPRASWNLLWRAPVRALLLGLLFAVAAGLFGAVGGAILCLIHGLPWGFGLGLAARAAFAGLAAGAVMGVVSAIYHVEEDRPKVQEVAIRKENRADRNLPVGRPLGDRLRNSIHHQHL
jgi:hypothetical protein